MKIETDRNLETNIATATQFKISENASKLFAMLGSYLYSKKEECVLHELSANAIDAHKMVGKENEPIHVILPTRFDAQLRIRDFGPGLSKENVYRFLTTYGESNKQESNDFIGGWGIGSKSPASVSDTWKIISHHQGEMTEYLVFINGDGIPSLTEIRSIPTDETGLEVSIPIPDHRVSVWQSAVPAVYAYYPVTPKVTNGGYHTVKSRVPAVKTGPNWWYEGGNHNNNSVVQVVASNRCYTCDTEKMDRELTDPRAKSLIRQPLFLEMKVGEVDLSISREQMQFTRKTLLAIEARLIEIYDHIKAEFEAAVAGHKDELDYRVRVMDYMRNKFSQSHHGFKNLPFMESFVGGKYGIKNVNDLVKYRFDFKNVDEPALIGMDIRVYNGKALKVLNASFNCWRDYAIMADNEYLSGKRVYDIRVQLDKLPRMKFYLADCKDAYARVRNTHDNQTTSFSVVFKSLNQIPALIASRVVNCSSLPVPVRAPRGSGNTRTKLDTDVYVMDGGRFTRKDGSVLLAVDANGEFVNKVAYVVTETFASTGALYHNSHIDTLLQLGYDVIGVKEDADAPDGVPSYKEAFEDYVDEYAACSGVQEDIKRMTLNQMTFGSYFTLMTLGIRSQKADSLWNTFLDTYAATIKDAANPRRDTSQYYAHIERMNVLFKMSYALDSSKPVRTLDLTSIETMKKDLTEIQKTYKMLSYLRTDVQRDADYRNVVSQFIDLAGV